MTKRVLSLAPNYNSNYIIHCKGLCNPCTIWRCNLLQEPITHLDMYLQCNRSDREVSKHWHWWLQSAAGAGNKIMGMKLMVAFKNSGLSLLFELSLLLSVTKEEDTKKHLLLYEHFIKCTCTQRTFTNPVHHYNDCKLLNNFPWLKSDKYCLRVFFS